MELRHLRYFVAVAKHLSFTAAARDLGIAQPPLSQQIRDLEVEIGTELFERTTRRVALTPAGQDFLTRAISILERATEAIDRARAIGGGTAGIINVGLTGSMLAGPLGKLIHAFGKNYPEVDLRIHEMSPDKQVSALKHGHTDISFLRSPPQDTDLARELAWKESINVILPAGHHLAAHENLSLPKLRSETFVFLRLKDSLFANYLWEACVENGFAPRISQQVVEAASLTSLVAAGLGIAMIPEFIGNFKHPKVIYKQLDTSSPSADVYALYIKGPGSIVENFLSAMRSSAQNFAEQLRSGEM
ncbi:LysR family transcriptional regulator [Methylobacterium nigriterrae]|uniref:LysR family transcriptional regulator n=1 Tax=Methylobacterium nigriterrae TaxID=3127512 RepID=UPI003013E4C3